MPQVLYGQAVYDLGKDVTNDFDVKRSPQPARNVAYSNGVGRAADHEYQGMTKESLDTADKMLEGTDFELV